MGKKYLLVDIGKDKIQAIQKVKESERVQVNRNKAATQVLWTVKSYADAFEIIRNHNELINKPVVLEKAHVSVQIKEWDWEKVDDENKDKLVQLFIIQDWKSIFDIHNTLGLTDENYCCDGYRSKVEFNMNLAKQKTIIDYD